MSLTLNLDFEYNTSIEKLWNAITDADKLAKWVVDIRSGQAMENNFKPVVGHQFQFRAQPTEYWSGIIEGEVLVVEAPHRLSYTWASGETHTVTWTLQKLGDGKVKLHLEQTGISSEPARAGAKHGWTKWLGELEKALEQ
ncbi:SRPBCC family protein [Cohnella sp. 56]|uniref:SRPBCC family protein n=1 Tax=Cohnella sp. 56 TaxID=3113722 RepID=UPI0030E9B0A6